MSSHSACKFEAASAVQVKCVAGRGMFPHESGILIRGTDRFYEAIVDSDLLHSGDDRRPDAGEYSATIDALIVKVNCDSLLVELPRQVVSGGRRIWIPISEVA